MLHEAQKWSLNHRMFWDRRDLGDHLIPISLPWTHFTRPGCSKPIHLGPEFFQEWGTTSSELEIQGTKQRIVCNPAQHLMSVSQIWGQSNLVSYFSNIFSKFIGTCLRSIEHSFTLKQTGWKSGFWELYSLLYWTLLLTSCAAGLWRLIWRW